MVVKVHEVYITTYLLYLGLQISSVFLELARTVNETAPAWWVNLMRQISIVGLHTCLIK